MNATRYPPMPRRIRIPVHPFGWTQRQWHIVRSVRTLSPSAVQDGERHLAAYLGTGLQVRLFDSGTAALLGVLRAANLREDGQVLVPAFICPSVVEAIIAARLRPVLFDSELTAEPSPESLERQITQDAVAVILPDYYGRMSATFAACERIARDNDLFVIADAAQSFGCRSADVCSAGRGDAAVLSFGRTKPLNAWSGGAVVTRTPRLMERLKMSQALDDKIHRLAIKRMHRDATLRRLPAILGPILTTTGMLMRMETDVIPVLEKQTDVAHKIAPARISPLGASLLSSQLGLFPQRLARWAHNAEILRDHLSDCPSLKLWPGCAPSSYPAHFPVLVEPQVRFRLAAYLSRQGIQTTWFHYPLHRLSPYRVLSRDQLHGAEWLWRRVLCIPCRDIDERSLLYVASAVKGFMSREA